MVKPLIIRNARVWDGSTPVRRELYTTDRVLAQPANGAAVIDLDGYAIFPGLINPHDHLELNHFPRTKFRDTYNNAHQWGDDVSKCLNDEPFKSLRAYPLWDRVFIGGLKNLLCGATTVVHHNPPHKELFRTDFPVRVLRRYGWAHSLHFSSNDEIVRAYRRTPPDVPFFIHLAEGTDEIAAGEYRRLKALGCVGSNTVLIHGVGLTDEDIADAAPRVRGLVICPTTNRYLLGATAKAMAWVRAGGRVAIGSDSRLTADGDLLDEMTGVEYDGRHTSRLIGWHTVGNLAPNAHADWIVFERHTHGYTLHLVVRGGVPQIGDPDLMLQFPYESIPATLDGVPKRIHIDLARQIVRCAIPERRLEIDTLPDARRKTFIGIRL